MHQQDTRVSGHVKLVKRAKGQQFYAKYRGADGQSTVRLGPAWTRAGRPPAGHLSRKAAQEKLDAILVDERRKVGRPRTADLLSSGGGVTFADAATEYLRFVGEVRRIDAGTVADYKGVIDGYLLEEFAETPLEFVTADAIDEYKERLIAEGKLSSRTIVRHLTVLHGIFKRAKRKYGLALNPAGADLVERPRVSYTGEFDTFDRDEIERLVAAAKCERDATLYRAAAFTGLRTGELMGLRWGCVDLLGGLLHVRRSWDFKHKVSKVPKGKRVRSVPLMPEMIDAFAKLKGRDHFTEDGDLVFCSEVGEHLNYWKHLERYKDALAAAGLREVRFHDLRHAFGSAAITMLDPYAVQSYMGHQHYSTTQRYLHHKPRREDAARLSEAFRAPDAATAVSGHEPEDATRVGER